MYFKKGRDEEEPTKRGDTFAREEIHSQQMNIEQSRLKLSSDVICLILSRVRGCQF